MSEFVCASTEKKNAFDNLKVLFEKLYKEPTELGSCNC